jgi:OOP family OmpA-OmpF porin
MRLHPFLSLDPELVLKRARIYLGPPDSVSIAVDQGVLTIRGTASHEWILQTRNATAQLGMAGIREVGMGDLQDSDLELLRAAIEGQIIVFPVDSSAIGPKQVRIVTVVAAQLQQWIRNAIAIGRNPRLQVIGYTDPSGTPQRNRNLSQERAAHVAAFLYAAAVPRELVQVVGKEASRSSAEAAAVQRRVAFQLFLCRRGEEQKEAR